jgi:hypothetical protein
MTHRPDRVSEVIALGRAGESATQISRTLMLPRETVRDWLTGRVPASTQPGAAACDRCGGAAHPYAELPKDYVYLLGLYLGDGCVSRHAREVYRLRITLDVAYPGIIAACAHAMAEVLPRAQRVAKVPRKGCCDVSSYWKGWPCLLPQVGPGKKHHRPIVLSSWQDELVARHPAQLLRGLIHSDGCRFINTGTNWVHPRYSFSNRSDDIRRIFCEACDRLGLHYTTCPYTVYVSRRADVAVLDEHVGPKT